MLQIIGWLLCVYLIVKGFELLAMKQPTAYVGAAIAFLAAPVFFLLINEQSQSSATPLRQFGTAETYNSQIDTQVEADAMASDAAVDEALEEAQRAIENADGAIKAAKE